MWIGMHSLGRSEMTANGVLTKIVRWLNAWCNNEGCWFTVAHCVVVQQICWPGKLLAERPPQGRTVGCTRRYG